MVIFFVGDCLEDFMMAMDARGRRLWVCGQLFVWWGGFEYFKGSWDLNLENVDKIRAYDIPMSFGDP